MRLLDWMSESKSVMLSPRQCEDVLFQAAAQLTGTERTDFLNGAFLGDTQFRKPWLDPQLP